MQILIVDDHPLFRMGLRAIISASAATQPRVVECDNFECAQNLLEKSNFDLILLDLLMPGISTLEEVFVLVAMSGAASVAVVSGVATPDIAEMVRLSGAAAFIPKTLPPEEIGSALRAVMRGERVFCGMPAPSNAAKGEDAALTPMQSKVMMLLSKGKSNKEIANELQLSANTIKVHVTKILKKFGVSSRAQAIAAIRRSPHPETVDG